MNSTPIYWSVVKDHGFNPADNTRSLRHYVAWWYSGKHLAI